MGLAAFKENLDTLAASMPMEPSRPVHPILNGVQGPDKAQGILDALEEYETSMMAWRSEGLGILHELRRSLIRAAKDEDITSLRYALDDTIPKCIEAIDQVRGHVAQPWPIFDKLNENRRLGPSDKRFVKYLRKRVRDFGTSFLFKADHLRDAFSALAWEHDPEASEVLTTLENEADFEAFFAGLPAKE
jgi:hypothetical protein